MRKGIEQSQRNQGQKQVARVHECEFNWGCGAISRRKKISNYARSRRRSCASPARDNGQPIQPSALDSYTLTRLRTPIFPLVNAHLVEEPNHLSGNVLATGLLVVHDAGGGGEDDVPELTRGQELDDPLLEFAKADVVSGRNDTRLVETGGR